MTKVILHGCAGRMGSVLTQLIADMSDMEIVAGIDVQKTERPYPVYASLELCKEHADALIDFSLSSSLPGLLSAASERKLPLVIATTGLTKDDEALLEQTSNTIPIFRSGNMSLGINLVQQLLQSAVKVLGEQFDVEIIEKHHNLKKDAPSGTALMLADSINEAREQKLTYVYGREGREALRTHNEIGIHAVRGGTIVGQHEVIFAGQDEVITIQHQAFSRQVFATGAIAAAHYIARQQNGLYSMKNLIQESSTRS